MEKKTDNKKKVLLLGGEGFIGRNIASELAKQFPCFSLGLQESVFSSVRPDVFIKGDPYRGELADKFDVYIHLIDNNIPIDDFEKEERKMQANLDFPEGSHLIVFSSAVVYANPDSQYAQRKFELERVYEEFCRRRNMGITIFRLFNVYGKFQLPYRQGGLIANILFNNLVGKSVEINDMSAKRDFMFAGDLAKFVYWTVENEFFGKTDLATGELKSIKELLEICKGKIGLKRLDVVDNKVAENISCPAGKNDLLGKVKLKNLEAGLRETNLFYKRNLSLIKKSLNI